MAAKGEIISGETIKPSTPTPDNLRNFKLSLLDQLAPQSMYIPFVLFYSASDISSANFGTTTDFTMISHKLKTSLSHVLTLYYPFCGRLKDNFSVECNDSGVIFIESKVPTNLSDILTNPQLDEIKQFLPFDPYNNEEHAANMGVQLNQFSCGGIALGLCFSHIIADGATAASFLNAWASIARGKGNTVVAPQMEAANFLFPPRNTQKHRNNGGMIGNQDIVRRRFIFNGTNLSRLRDKLGSFNPTRVEAVTALIWKSALEAAAKANSEEQILHASMVSHMVNIRGRMVPPLCKHMGGNLWLRVFSPLVEVKGKIELHDLAEVVRKMVKRVDADYISQLQGDGFPMVIESLKEAGRIISEKRIPVYLFSSWTRFGFYENDFGWGKPTWVCTVGVPIKNVVILMSTRDGDGIEAWVTLTKLDMVQFELNLELLHFTSFDYYNISG